MMEILGAFARNLVQQRDRSREEIRSSAQYLRRRMMKKRQQAPLPVDTRRIADKVTASVASHISRMAAKRRQQAAFSTYPFFAPVGCYPPSIQSSPFWSQPRRGGIGWKKIARRPMLCIAPGKFAPMIRKRRLFRKQRKPKKTRESVIRSTKLRKGSMDHVRTSGKKKQYLFDSDDSSPDSSPRGELAQKPKQLMDYIRELHDHMTEKQDHKESGTEQMLKKMKLQLKKHEKALKERSKEAPKKHRDKSEKKSGDGDTEKPKEKKKKRESAKKAKKVKKTCFIKESVSSVVASSACKLKHKKKKKAGSGDGKKAAAPATPAPLSFKRSVASSKLSDNSNPMSLKAQMVS